MDALILILHLGFLISFGFCVSTEDPTRAESNLDLECQNDFLTSMMCRLTPNQPDNCSEYSLNLTGYDNELFECDFKLNSRECECSLQVQSGFVVNENLLVKVLRRKTLVFVTNISTTDSIKPKKPAIVSVNQTQNGNYIIFWDTGYRTSASTFNSELIPELIYYTEGSKEEESRKIEDLPKDQGYYELISRNLESNSHYIVKARVRCDLNSVFSDYSDPYKFTTPSSLKDFLKMLIPVICVVLIVSISVIYYSYSKILTEWWDKVPTPKIATSFVKQVPNLLSFQNEFSPVRLDSSKLVNVGEKTWPASSLVDGGGESSLNSLGKDGNSANVIYGQTGNESLEETGMENTTRWESESSKLHRIPMSDQYQNLKSSRDDCDVGRGSGNSSGISNRFYMLSTPDKFHHPATRHICSDFFESENMFPAPDKNLEPMILTDFEYSPFTGACTGSENTSPTLLTPSSDDITLVPGYQSVHEVDRTPTDHAFISSHNDVNLIMDRLVCSKDPRSISSESEIIQVENGYKDFQSLLRNSGEQQIPTEPELKHPCGLPLHTAPGIQIDYSYHRV